MMSIHTLGMAHLINWRKEKKKGKGGQGQGRFKS
jgi:hypothetical protein